MIIIGDTNKGKRVWIQNTCTKGWAVGMPYHTTYEQHTIVVQLAPEGKRKVAKGKGGILDFCGKKVTQWAQGSTHATVVYDRDNGRILITRV